MSDQLLREVNRQIYDVARVLVGATHYVCECGDVDCRVTTLTIDPLEVADVLWVPDTLIVAPGHEPAGTTLLAQRAGYLVLQKRS